MERRDLFKKAAAARVGAMKGVLVRVVASHFVAGLIVHRRAVVHSAPILRYLIGRDFAYAADYFKRKNWTWTRL